MSRLPNETDTIPSAFLAETVIERLLAQFTSGIGVTALLIGAIIGGALLGKASPTTGATLGGFVDNTVLVLVGLLVFEVKISAIVKNGSNLRFLWIAWFTNFVLIPTIGSAIASLFFSGQPLFFTGLIIYFMAPCTDWFLGFTRLAKGNTALGAALLPINMTTQLLLYPVYLRLFAEGAAPVSLETVGTTLLQWFGQPFLIAVAVHQVLRLLLSEGLFSRLLAWVSYAIPFVIAALIVEIFASNIEVIVEHASVFLVMLIAIFLFFVATFVVGEIISKIARFAYPERALLTMTTAARNAPLMLGITAVALPDQPLIYAAIIIGMLVEFPHLTALRQILLSGRHSNPGTPMSRRTFARRHFGHDVGAPFTRALSPARKGRRS